MPYISPSLSPTRSFQSPAHSVSGGSGTSSPAEPASPSISTAPRWDTYSSSSSSYNPYGHALVDGLSSSATSAATSSSSASALKRPPHRHHSRSHSSDTLVSLGGSAGGRHSHQHYSHHHLLYPQHQASSSSSSSSSQPPHHRHAKSSKMTPDFIYVQPASPGPDEQPPSGNGDGNNNSNSSSSHYDSLPTSSGRSHSYSYPSSSNSSSSTTTSSNRPGLRRSSASSRQSAAAAFGEYAAYHSPSSPTAGDYGDVPPPRSSSSSNLSSQARRSRRQMSASADSSPRHSISYHTPLPRIADDETAYMTGAVAKGSPPITPVTSHFDASNGNATTTRSGPTLSSASSTSPRQSRTSLPRLKSASMQPSFSDSALATSSSSASSVNNTSDDDSDNTKAAAKAALHSPLLQKHKPSWGELPVSSSLLGGNLSTAFQFGQSLPTTPNGSVHVGGGGGSNSASSGSSTPTPKAEKPEETAIAWGSASGNGSAPDGGLQLHASNDGESDRAEWGPPGSSSSSSTQPSTKSSTTTNASSSSAVAASELNGSGAGSGSGSGTSSGSSESSPTSTPASSASLPIKGLPSSAAVTAGAGVTPTSGPLAPAAVKLRRPTHTKAFSERAESPFRLEFEANNHHNQNSTHPSTHSRMTGLRQREASEGSAPAPGASSTSSSSSAHLGQYNHGGLTVHTHHPLHHFQQLHSGPSRSGSHRPSPLPTPMLRKKSGELVKSSMKHDSRAKSAPTTPTGPKAVHFDEQLERVKLFLAQQKPTAVSRDGSPQETETEDDSEATAFPFPPMTTSIPAQITLVLPDFPKNMLPDLGSRDACLESLEIAADSRSLKGSALLRNIAFEKRLSIRFTFDDWQTVSEVTGEWQSTLSGGNIDRWTFRIKLDDMLARIEDKKLYLALRYTVGGRDIWDSNNGANYRAEFRKQAARSQAVVGGSRAARHEWAVTNAGQANERMADLRRELDRLVAGHEDDDFSSADELVISSNNGGKGFKYQHRFLGGESVPLAQAPASNTFSSRYDFGASLKQATSSASNPATSQAQHRNSPQTSHAVLDNPYFAAPNASEAMISSWRNAASVITQSGHHSLAPAPSPLSASVPATSNETVSPKSQHQSLYADDIAPVMTTTVIGGMPATTFIGGAEPSASTPPASFSGADYYPRTEHNGVISQDFGLPNFMSYMNLGNHDNVDIPSSATSSPRTEVPSSASSSTSTAMPGSYFPAGDPISSASSSTSNSASNSTTPSTEHSPTADFSGGAPLARQNRFNSFPPTRSFMMDGEGSASPGSFRPAVRAYPNFGQGEPVRPSVLMHGNRQHSASSLSDILDASLMDSAMDPRDTSIYSPAISPRSTSPPISSSAEIPGAHQRRPSPPPRPISPDDLLSPSPSSASTDTSISTPQSPGGSPPLRMYSPFIASGNGNGGRPEMGSDTYFNFVHRYCWGNGDTASSSSSSSSTSTALGLAGLNPTTFEAPTPRRATPPSSCSASLLSSPTQSQSGSRTPSPKNGSPTLETVQRMEAKGYMNGPPTVQI